MLIWAYNLQDRRERCSMDSLICHHIQIRLWVTPLEWMGYQDKLLSEPKYYEKHEWDQNIKRSLLYPVTTKCNLFEHLRKSQWRIRSQMVFLGLISLSEVASCHLFAWKKSHHQLKTRIQPVLYLCKVHMTVFWSGGTEVIGWHGMLCRSTLIAHLQT